MVDGSWFMTIANAFNFFLKMAAGRLFANTTFGFGFGPPLRFFTGF
jgi:hypothetical protein